MEGELFDRKNMEQLDAGPNSEARDWRIAYKQPFLTQSQESAKQESNS
eukprot:COSAG01_NODE_73374_length_247_cov_2.290541_1_plen_47_part_01